MFLDLNANNIKNHTYDGIHLKASGYELWKNAVNDVIKKLEE